jgi:hypothetical protein
MPRLKPPVPLPENPDAIERRRLIMIGEAANLLGCSEDTIRRKAARGEGLKLFKISPRRVGIRLGDVLALTN